MADACAGSWPPIGMPPGGMRAFVEHPWICGCFDLGGSGAREGGPGEGGECTLATV